MRILIIFLLLAGAGVVTWLVLARPAEKSKVEDAPKPLPVSQYSAGFNASVSDVLKRYYTLSELLVRWDSTKVKRVVTDLHKSLDSLSLTEVKDTLLQQTALSFLEYAKTDAAAMQTASNIRPQREAYHSLTDNLYQFLNTVKYDREKLYLNECEMAFDDDKSALWMSSKPEIRNPYLGMFHPYYKSGMLKCGDNKQVIDHTGAQ